VSASVIIPTIGRPAQLASALASLAACRPWADEVVVVDQSQGPETERVVERFMANGARRIPCDGRGIGLAINAGLRAASNDLVLITNDDCTVAGDWVAVAIQQLAHRRRTIVTGSVLPAGDSLRVPSAKQEPLSRDYTGSVDDGALYGANMAASRTELLEIGGFDERITPSAEDNDLGYRWLRSGRSLRYEPAMRIWHHDWRTPAELRSLHRRYGAGQGMFYAKHLATGDWTMLRFLLRDLRVCGPAAARALCRGRRPPDWSEGVLLGLPVGLTRGLRTFVGSRS
jgi:GT2 family glycosyltransferase